MAAGLVAVWCRFGDVVTAWRRSGTYGRIPFGSGLAPLWHLRQTPVWCRAHRLLLKNTFVGYTLLIYVAGIALTLAINDPQRPTQTAKFGAVPLIDANSALGGQRPSRISFRPTFGSVAAGSYQPHPSRGWGFRSRFWSVAGKRFPQLVPGASESRMTKNKTHSYNTSNA